MTYSDYGPGCMRNNGFIEGPVFQNQLQPNTNCLCGVRTNLVTSIFTKGNILHVHNRLKMFCLKFRK